MCVCISVYVCMGFPSSANVKNLPANAGDVRDTGSVPGSGRCPGGGNGNPPQYYCLEMPTDGGGLGLLGHKELDTPEHLNTAGVYLSYLQPKNTNEFLTSR